MSVKYSGITVCMILAKVKKQDILETQSGDRVIMAFLANFEQLTFY